MGDKCAVCGMRNVALDHTASDKHLRNVTLQKYTINRPKYAENRAGITLTVNVSSSFSYLNDCTDDKIQISTKPDERIKFDFSISNDNKLADVFINLVEMVHNNMNFTIHDHGLGARGNPLKLAPGTKIQNKISVVFRALHIGQYEMPIMFSFSKSRDKITIMREMVVFVEDNRAVHEIETSPYALKAVTADTLIKTSIVSKYNDMFRVPKSYKSIFAMQLKVKDGASEQEVAQCEDLKKILDDGVTNENYIPFFHNLLWYEETMCRISLRKYNMSGVPLTAYGALTFSLKVPGLAEKRPSLMAGDIIYVKPHDNREVIFEGVIATTEETIAVIKGLPSGFHSYYNSGVVFDIRFCMPRLPLERMHQAVHCVTKDSPHVCRVFPQANLAVRLPEPIQNYFNPLIEKNVEQCAAVEHIVAGTSGAAPYLLHGPPGTGKTVTIVEAVLQLVKKDPNYRIMVCTESNMAADHVATAIVNYAHMFDKKLLLRANSRHRSWGCLPAALFEWSNGTTFEKYSYISIENFKSYHIVVTTLSHADKYGRDLRERRMERYLTHLFIDEAAQTSEPSSLIPLCALLMPQGSLILAGDPQQLGPVIISHDAKQIGLGLSLMERLKKTCPLYSDERKDPNYVVMLRNNFRSHADILSIPNDLFYDGQLRVYAAPDKLSKTDVLGERSSSRAIVFHGVLSKEEKMGKSPSFFNTMELEIIKMYVNKLINDHKVLPEDIGVITPYIRQMYKVKQWLATQPFGKGLEVGTVEAFQGKEKRVIVISTVRAACGLLEHDAKYQLGFLVDDKRFNVALTRAKAKAIVIGNPLCLQKDAKWRRYMQHCKDLGTYHGYEQNVNIDAAVARIVPLLNQIKITKKKTKK